MVYQAWNGTAVLKGLGRALTLTTLNNFGMNWKAGCAPSLLTQQCDQCLTSLWLKEQRPLHLHSQIKPFKKS